MEARDAALTAVEEADKESARTRLDELAAAFGCGDVAEKDAVAELFLLEGALASFDKDGDALDEAFRSAAAVSENLWLSSLGPVLQERFVAARAVLLDSGEIAFEPAVDGYIVSVDGERAMGDKVLVNEGLHLVQVGTEDDVLFASVVSVLPRSQVVVDHDLPSLRVLPPPPPPEEDDDRSGLLLFAGVGIGLGLGESLEGATTRGVLTESGSKILLPLELGVMGRGNPVWWRGVASVAPVLSGELLYSTDGDGKGSRVVGGGHVAGGVLAGTAHLGVLTGPAWPGRWQVRAVGGTPVVGPLTLEARAGLNLVTERRPEPALEVVIALAPVLFRSP